jgi:hypothetical protein
MWITDSRDAGENGLNVRMVLEGVVAYDLCLLPWPRTPTPPRWVDVYSSNDSNQSRPHG